MLQNYNTTTTFTLKHSILEVTELYKLNALIYVYIIDVSYNSMCCNFSFKTLINCQKLREIHLSHNNFKTIHSNLTDFEMYPLLRKINLSYNNITYISINTFKYMPELRHISLVRNKLTRIDGFSTAQDVIPKIKLMSINGNHFTCRKLIDMLLFGNTTRLQFQWYEQSYYVDECVTEIHADIEVTITDITSRNTICCVNSPENITNEIANYDFTSEIVTQNTNNDSELEIVSQTTKIANITFKATIIDEQEATKTNEDETNKEKNTKTKASLVYNKILVLMAIVVVCVIFIYLILPLACKKYNTLNNEYSNTTSVSSNYMTDDRLF